MQWFRNPKPTAQPAPGDGLLDHPDLSRLPAEVLADLPMPRPCTGPAPLGRCCA